MGKVGKVRKGRGCREWNWERGEGAEGGRREGDGDRADGR